MGYDFLCMPYIISFGDKFHNCDDSLIHWVLNEMAAMSQKTLSNVGQFVFWLQFRRTLFLWPNLQHSSIHPGIDLATKWQQIITWVTGDPDYWHLCVTGSEWVKSMILLFFDMVNGGDLAPETTLSSVWDDFKIKMFHLMTWCRPATRFHVGLNPRYHVTCNCMEWHKNIHHTSPSVRNYIGRVLCFGETGRVITDALYDLHNILI